MPKLAWVQGYGTSMYFKGILVLFVDFMSLMFGLAHKSAMWAFHLGNYTCYSPAHQLKTNEQMWLGTAHRRTRVGGAGCTSFTAYQTENHLPSAGCDTRMPPNPLTTRGGNCISFTLLKSEQEYQRYIAVTPLITYYSVIHIKACYWVIIVKLIGIIYIIIYIVVTVTNLDLQIGFLGI